MKFGFFQRTSVYWPNNHEAGERSVGVAAMKAYTAYQPPYYKDNKIPPNRPGAPARVITWVDPDHRAELAADIASLKQRCDIVISSHHWGYGEEVLQYQKELAHTAIDAGADIVRVSCPDEESTAALSQIVKGVNVPIVADIHFHYKRAIEAAKAGAACLRINPGNIGSKERVREVVDKVDRARAAA